MLNFYLKKIRSFAFFLVLFDIKPCLIVSSYKNYVSISIFLVCNQDVFAEISQNLKSFLIKTTIQP